MAVVIEVVRPVEASDEVPGNATVVEVVRGTESPIATENVATSVVEVTKPGGTLANVHWGFGLPENPYEGMIWIDVT